MGVLNEYPPSATRPGNRPGRARLAREPRSRVPHPTLRDIADHLALLHGWPTTVTVEFTSTQLLTMHAAEHRVLKPSGSIDVLGHDHDGSAAPDTEALVARAAAHANPRNAA